MTQSFMSSILGRLRLTSSYNISFCQCENLSREFLSCFIIILFLTWKYCDIALHFRARSTLKILRIKNAYSTKFEWLSVGTIKIPPSSICFIIIIISFMRFL